MCKISCARMKLEFKQNLTGKSLRVFGIIKH